MIQMEVTFSPLKRSLKTHQKGHSEEAGGWLFDTKSTHSNLVGGFNPFEKY